MIHQRVKDVLISENRFFANFLVSFDSYIFFALVGISRLIIDLCAMVNARKNVMII